MTARDGRKFELADPQLLIAQFKQNDIDLPIDYEHQSDRKRSSGPVPAAGWIKELKALASGLWGRVEWTAQARELIASKAYRFLSPTFFYTKDGNVITRLKGAGLVHSPALHLKALASEDQGMITRDDFMQRLQDALGLSGATSEDDILQAIGDLLTGQSDRDQDPDNTKAASAHTIPPDPAKFVPVDVVQDLLRDRDETRSEHAAERAETRVRDALKRGYITPGMRDWALALCTRDEASFDDFMAKALPTYAYLSKQLLPNHPPDRTSGTQTCETSKAICEQLGLSDLSLSE